MFSNDITMIDQVETKKAEEILNQHKKIYLLWIIPPVFCLIGLLLYRPAVTITIGVIINILFFLAIISAIIIPLICAKHLKPYKELLKIAKENDKIRHIEKVKFFERNRLYTQGKQKQQITKNKIIQTNKIFDDKNKE